MQYLVRRPGGETQWVQAHNLPADSIQQFSSKQNKIRRRKQLAAKRQFEQGLRGEETRPRYKERVRLNRD